MAPRLWLRVYHHKRYTTIDGSKLKDIKELNILAESDETGPHIIATPDKRKIFVQGHMEYDTETLKLEYERDIEKGFNCSLPKNYYVNDDPQGAVKVTNEMVSLMKPGSVLVDVAIDQGGCFEDSRPTTHADPVFRVHDSVFYCVANMPGAVPSTSTWALTNATLPYVCALADKGWRAALRDDRGLALGLNTWQGKVTCAGVGQAFPDLPAADLDEALA